MTLAKLSKSPDMQSWSPERGSAEVCQGDRMSGPVVWKNDEVPPNKIVKKVGWPSHQLGPIQIGSMDRKAGFRMIDENTSEPSHSGVRDTPSWPIHGLGKGGHQC